MNIHDVTPEMVGKVYSGRKGCACGCRGKYYYASGYNDRGYALDHDEVSDKAVRRVLNLFKKNASLVEYNDEYSKFFWFDKPGADRTYTVYLKEAK